MTFEDTHIDGGHLEVNNAKIDGCGVLNLSHLHITSVPLVQKHPSPLNLDEAEISGGTVNLERIRITTGPDQPEVTWSGGREKGGGQFIASFQRLNLVDGRISFRDTEIPYGEFSFKCINLTGGVLDFECARLADCCLDFTGAKIDGSSLNFSNSHIGVFHSSDVPPRSGFFYEWLENLKNVKDVSGRDMVFNRPYGVVMFWDAELGSGHLKFDRASSRGALLQFSGMRASSGKITFAGGMFDSSAISFWNADLSGECEIEIRPLLLPCPGVTVLYSQAYGGLNGRVVYGAQVELLEVSGAD